MFRYLWLMLALTFAVNGLSQSATDNFLEAGAAFGKSQSSFSVHYLHMWKLGKSQKFSIGIGGRMTTYLGTNQYYVTAPAELTSESTSPLIFFKENINANIDSLFLPSPGLTMFNATINIQYKVAKRIGLGFSIDAVGVSIGGKQSGVYINGPTYQNTLASPTSFNVLLVSDNDRGSLNSEFFAKYDLDEKWSLKGGLQFLFTEYTTNTKVQQYPSENDRFRVKSFMVGLGVCYRLK